MTNDLRYLMVLSTCPDADTARHIADQLVTGRLAACVQLIPDIRSVFRWEGRVDEAGECLLLIKTGIHCYQELENKIKSLHPYELPEIIAVPVIKGLDDYLSWIDKC